jgi:hypothetical protein
MVFLSVLQQDLPLSGFLFLKNSIAFVDQTYHQFVRHKYFFHILYTEYNKLLQQFYLELFEKSDRLPTHYCRYVRKISFKTNIIHNFMARKTDVGHAGKTVLYVRILLNQHRSKITKVIPMTFKAVKLLEQFIVFCVQNVKKIFMSDKLVISLINECYWIFQK